MSNSITPVSIMKQVVQAKTRKLSARWTFEVPTPFIQTLSLHELIEWYYIQYAGSRVDVYENDHDAEEWLEQNATCKYKVAFMEDDIVTPEKLRAELERRYGLPATLKLGPTYPYVNHAGIDLESEIMQSLSHAISAEMEKEFLHGMGVHRKQPIMMAYLLDPQEALRFKLSWGGHA